MPTKLTELKHLELLGIGNILKKYIEGDREEGGLKAQKMHTYEVISINRPAGIWKLKQIDDPGELFAWPEDIEYFMITSSKLLSEKSWWVG